MHIVTVATKSEGYFDYLVESCKRNGGELEVLGWGKQWKGFMMKINLLKEYLNNLDDDDIVCYVDGYDVIILQSVDKIETLFRSSGKKILFSRDSNIDIIPFFEMFCKTYFGTYKNYRLSAGTFIGYVKYLKKVVNDICNENNCNDKNLDDQIILTKICNKYNDNNIDIDVNRDIFLVVQQFDSNINKIQIKNNQLIFNNNNKPCIIHGVVNYNLNTILKKLGYNIDKIKHRDHLSYFFTTSYFKIIIIIIIIFIIIVLFNRKYLKKN
jgi:hypothetical protein